MAQCDNWDYNTMNKTIISAAASKGWIFALLAVIFAFLWVLPLQVVPFLGDAIEGMVLLSVVAMVVYTRDMAYGFADEECVAVKDAAIGFLLLLLGIILEDYGSLVIATIWKIFSGVLILCGGLKIMKGFGVVLNSPNGAELQGVKKLKLAGLLLLICGIIAILHAIPAIGLVFWIIFKILFIVAFIMMMIGMGSMKKIA